MSDYKDLNLNREKLDHEIATFLEKNGYSLDGGIQVTDRKKRVVFGRAGDKFAIVDLYLNNTGTTTIQYKTGPNQGLGEQLAIYLKATINPAEFETVNFSFAGILPETLSPIIDLIIEDGDIDVLVENGGENRKRFRFSSRAHHDSLTVTHHIGTRVLQIQGKPLTCYRRLIYLLTDVLDLKGLDKVLCRKDDSSAEIVRAEMATDYLKGVLSNSWDHLPPLIKKLLISGCCIKLASPVLPDYCLLLYPDLRSLEGVLKDKMADCGLSYSEAKDGFGTYFKGSDATYALRPEYSHKVNNVALAEAFGRAYSFYKIHRHTIFHMEEFVSGSRMVDTLDKAIALSKDIYRIIDGIYAVRM